MELIAFGHKNLLGEHKTTFEFTKDKNLTKRGDCIIGTKLNKIPESMEGKIKIILEVKNEKEEITAEANPSFENDNEMIFRVSNFIDERTFAIRCSKSSREINRKLIKLLKNSKEKLKITIKQYS